MLLLLMLATPEADFADAVEKVSKDHSKGLVHLLKGQRSSARLALQNEPKLAVYLAMAEMEGAGGLGRAREVLARAARSPDAAPGVLFLASLAFFSTDPAKADQL